jgi:AcrR family transcriptional regulator
VIAVTGGPFVLSELLRQLLAGMTGLGRSARTRATLEIAAAELLQEHGFYGLKVSEICARADCGHGTFYRYWPNREAVTHTVLTQFMEAIRTQRPRPAVEHNLFDRLVANHAYYIAVHRRNAGLSRCMLQLSDERPEFSRIGIEANIRLAHRVVRAFEREDPEQTRKPEAERLVTAHGCIAMVDGLLRAIDLRGLDLHVSGDGLAREFALIWYRAFCGRDPAPPQRQRRSSRS